MTAYADIAVALLAAGRGVRFGSDKLLARIGGEPLGLKVANTLTELDFGYRFAICKTGSDLSACYSNDEPEIGQAHSLHLAVKAVMTTEATALLVMLADMPFVSAGHVTALVAAYKCSITASSNGVTPMPPAIFPRERWSDLLATSGDSGARELLKGASVIAAPAAELRDIDIRANLPVS
jgi:molybdenum cofactor cytidylyltransferase